MECNRCEYQEECDNDKNFVCPNGWKQEPEAWEPQINQAAFEALDMAIKALEQQPCEDTISRQAAIDALGEKPLAWTEGEYELGLQNQWQSDVDALNGLPSAQPEQRWIPCSERLPKKEKKTYWVCTDTEYQCECRWTNNRFGLGEGEWGWSIFDTPQYSKPIAWMPLPEPYREERTEE